MVDRHFGSTEHLASEAVAAYVDGELRMTAHLRASAHLSICPECAAEVEAQRQARAALQKADELAVPSALLGLLQSIPSCDPRGRSAGIVPGRHDHPPRQGRDDPPPGQGDDLIHGQRFAGQIRRFGRLRRRH